MGRPANEIPTLFSYRGRWCWKVGEQRRTLCPLTPEQTQAVGYGKRPQPTREQQAQLLAVLLETQPTRRDETMRVDALCNAYLANREGCIHPEKHEYYVFVLTLFCERFGANAIEDITPDMVQTFVKSRPSWRSLSTQRSAIKVVLQCFNFAVVNRIISSSPLIALGRALATDAPEQRREIYVSREQEAAILERLNPAARDIVRALFQTGRRPDELCALRKDGVVEAADGIHWRLDEHKNKKKTGKAEIIDHLRPGMQALTRDRLADERNQTPYLFVTKQGKPWTIFNLGKQFGDAVQKVVRDCSALGLDPDTTPYAARHTMITRSLMDGVPLAAVARWVGNSPAVLAKHYAHLEKVAKSANAAHVALLSAT